MERVDMAVVGSVVVFVIVVIFGGVDGDGVEGRNTISPILRAHVFLERKAARRMQALCNSLLRDSIRSN